MATKARLIVFETIALLLLRVQCRRLQHDDMFVDISIIPATPDFRRRDIISEHVDIAAEVSSGSLDCASSSAIADDFADSSHGDARRRAGIEGACSIRCGRARLYYGPSLALEYGGKMLRLTTDDYRRTAGILDRIIAGYSSLFASFPTPPVMDAYVSNTGLAPAPPDLYVPGLDGIDMPGLGGMEEVRLAFDVVHGGNVAVMAHELCHSATAAYVSKTGRYKRISEGVCEFFGTYDFAPRGTRFYDAMRRALETRQKNPLSVRVTTDDDECYWRPVHVWASFAAQFGVTTLVGAIEHGALSKDAESPWDALAPVLLARNASTAAAGIDLAAAYVRALLVNAAARADEARVAVARADRKLAAFYDADMAWKAKKSTMTWMGNCTFRSIVPLEPFGFDVYDGPTLVRAGELSVSVRSADPFRGEGDAAWRIFVLVKSLGSLQVVTSRGSVMQGTRVPANASFYIAVMHAIRPDYVAELAATDTAVHYSMVVRATRDTCTGLFRDNAS